MKIQFIPARFFGDQIQNGFCEDKENHGMCIHNDEEKILEFGKRVQIDNQKIWISLEVLYCPYCGFSYKEKK